LKKEIDFFGSTNNTLLNTHFFVGLNHGKSRTLKK